jgi:hypothetical protein
MPGNRRRGERGEKRLDADRLDGGCLGLLKHARVHSDDVARRECVLASDSLLEAAVNGGADAKSQRRREQRQMAAHSGDDVPSLCLTPPLEQGSMFLAAIRDRRGR